MERKTAAAVAEAKASGKELDPAFSTVLKPMRSGGLWAGSPVYVRRSPVATYTIFAIAAGFCLRSGYYVGVQLGPIPLLVGTALMFLWYDLYTGFLHVVLDEPENIKAPYIGQPALEFQWHHQIPTDIVRKDFSDVVGDLNVVVVILTFIHFFWSTSMGTDHIAGFLAGMKLLWAWYGQMSHRCAHNPKIAQMPVAQFLQKVGLMISVKDHKAHHQPPHEEDFCLIGVMNPVIDWLRTCTTNRHVWLCGFLFVTIFDVAMFACPMNNVFGISA